MSPLSIEQIQAMLDASPMVRFMGVQVNGVDTGTGSVHFTLPMRPEFERIAGTGQYHGGALANFIDTAGDFAVAVVVGGPVPTINLRVDFLRPAAGAQLRATAIVRRMGRTIAVVDVDVFDGESRLVAVGRGTFSTSAG
ncbi:MAG: hypothetical protein V7606_3123 [Burkholderiales bacterium]|jgi:uncharacterized protein (TIGR00369 family)